MEQLKIRDAVSEMKKFPEMLSTISAPGLEVYQVTTDLDSEAGAPEMLMAPVSYSPDSKRLVFPRTRGIFEAGGSARIEITLCEIGNRFALRPLTEEPNVRGYALSLDGDFLYYFVDESGRRDKPRIILKRVDIDHSTRETLMVVDSKVDGVGRVPRGGYMISEASLSSDGRKISTAASFYTESDPLYSSLIFDLEKMTVHGFQSEPYNWRPVGIYSRSPRPEHLDHMLLFHDHLRNGFDVHGKWYSEPADDVGCRTYHIVREDGNMLASLPVGVARGEGGPNHAIWRGHHYQVACHMSTYDTPPHRHWRGSLILAEPVATSPENRYLGKNIPGGKRWELTRHIKRPDCFHLAFDCTGTRMVSETEGVHGVGETSYLWIASIPDVQDPFLIPQYLLHPNSSMHSYSTQPKPSLTPDGKKVFFRSDYLCKREHPQLFCVTGY